MRAGDLIRIKEIPGTKLASKRKPVWALIHNVSAAPPASSEFDERNRWCVVAPLQTVVFQGGWRNADLVQLQRHCFDYPTDKQVPDWVWAEIAKRALTE